MDIDRLNKIKQTCFNNPKPKRPASKSPFSRKPILEKENVNK